MGVMLHVMGDAANNLGVMVAALVIWLTHYEGRYYADPATSMGIGFMIILTALPLSMSCISHIQTCFYLPRPVRNAGHILLESLPNGIDPDDVKHDLENVETPLSSTYSRIRLTIYRSRASWASTNCTSGVLTNKRHSHQSMYWSLITQCLNS